EVDYGAVNRQALDVALEVSSALVRVGRAVSRESSRRVALNRARLREKAERAAARNRRPTRSREALGRTPAARSARDARRRPGKGRAVRGLRDNHVLHTARPGDSGRPGRANPVPRRRLLRALGGAEEPPRVSLVSLAAPGFTDRLRRLAACLTM